MCRIRLMACLAVAVSIISAAPAAGALATPTRARVAQSSASFVRAYVDSASKNNAAAFGEDIFPTSDGGYILAGSVELSPFNAWIGKVSAAGVLQWQEQVGCGASTVLSVQQTSDGGYILTGGEESCAPQCAAGGFSSLSCAWVLKLGATGAVEWQFVYPGAEQSSGHQVEQTSDGGYVVTGSTTDSSGTNYAWVAKLSSSGGLQWQRQIGAAPFTDATTIRQTSDGGYIVGGSAGVIGNSSVLVIKLNSTGNIQWQQTYGTGYDDTANAVRRTSDGGYVVAGDIARSSPGGHEPDEALLLKLTSSGSIQWQQAYNAGLTERFGSWANSVLQAAGGGYVLAGEIQFLVDGAPAAATWLAKTTPAGAIIWQHTFVQTNKQTGLPYASSFAAVIRATGGGYIAVGYTDEYDNSDDILLVKTDANGNVASCPEQQTTSATAGRAGLAPSTSSFPAGSAGNAGAALSGGTGSVALVSHQDC